MFLCVLYIILVVFGCWRALDFQALIGQIGGYIGLILGYAILQLPDFLLTVFERLKGIQRRSLIQPSRPKRSVISVLPQRNDMPLKTAMEIYPKADMENVNTITDSITKCLEDNPGLRNAMLQISSRVEELSNEIRNLKQF